MGKCVYLAFKDELEGECTLAGQVGVAFRVVDAGLQHPRLVENREARGFIVQAGDEVISAVRPELNLCEADLLIAEQTKDAVIELHVSAVTLVHLSQYSHQLCTSLSGMGALTLMCWQLMERTLPGAADPLVLTLRHPVLALLFLVSL